MEEILGTKINNHGMAILTKYKQDSANTGLRDMIGKFEIHKRKMKKNKKQIIDDIEVTNQDTGITQLIEKLKIGEISIGDLAMEQLISMFGEFDFKQQPSPAKIRLKKDYITFIINDPNSDLTRYSVYALLVGAITSVLDVSFKKNLDLPILVYTETTQDPSDIIENVYFYEIQQHRTVFMRKFIKQQNNAARIIPLTILKHTEKRYDLFFTGDVIVEDVNQELIELEIIIRNKAYISTTPFETLLNMIVILTSF